MPHQMVTTRNAQRLCFSDVAGKCSVAGIYMTCKCRLCKLRGFKNNKINSVIGISFPVPKKKKEEEEDFGLCRPALLALWLVWLVARVRGCLLWLAATAAAASIVGVIKGVRPGRSAETGLEVEAPVVHGAR